MQHPQHVRRAWPVVRLALLIALTVVGFMSGISWLALGIVWVVVFCGLGVRKMQNTRKLFDEITDVRPAPVKQSDAAEERREA